MTIEEMRERKKELGYTNRMIAEKTGIPFSTVQKVFSGATTVPRRQTIEALEALLKPGMTYDFFSEYPENEDFRGGLVVKEKMPQYRTQRKYDLQDYLALPEDRRAELIDGDFYDLAAPTTIHQSVALQICDTFLKYVQEHNGPCYPFIAPVDVQLDCDDRTVLQPDVFVVCDRGKYKNGRIFGAPDLVVEIISPSTRSRDFSLKLHKYMNAGVREYWIVDPIQKKILQYDLENKTFPSIYSFRDKVPVLIWKGDCLVDFKELCDRMAFLWEAEEEDQ